MLLEEQRATHYGVQEHSRAQQMLTCFDTSDLASESWQLLDSR